MVAGLKFVRRDTLLERYAWSFEYGAEGDITLNGIAPTKQSMKDQIVRSVDVRRLLMERRGLSFRIITVAPMLFLEELYRIASHSTQCLKRQCCGSIFNLTQADQEPHRLLEHAPWPATCALPDHEDALL